MTCKPPSAGPSLLPTLAALATGIQVGSAMVATRVVVDQIGPASLALLRYAIGFACLLPAALLTWRAGFARRDVLPIALLGIGQFGVLIALLNWGLARVPSARAALIFALTPLLAMLLSATVGHERLTGLKCAGVLLSVGGVAAALGERAVHGGPSGWAGEAAVLASALTAATCSVLYRPYLRKYPALPVGALAMLASVAFLALLATGEGFFAAPPRLTARGWLAVAFIGVGSGAGYLWWLWALARAPVTRVTVCLALSPLTAMALGAVALGEPVSGHAALGLVAVVLGLALAHREPSGQPRRSALSAARAALAAGRPSTAAVALHGRAESGPERR